MNEYHTAENLAHKNYIPKLPQGDRNRKEAEESLLYFTVKITGLRPGETILGIRNNSKNSLLIYDVPPSYKKKSLNHTQTYLNYVIPPSKIELDLIRHEKDLWELFTEKLNSIEFFKNMSNLERNKWLDENESEKDVDISELGGYVEILQLGEGDLSNKLNEEQIKNICEKRIMPAIDLREMIPGKPGTNARRHTLFFMRSFWTLSSYENVVNQFEGIVFDIDSGDIYNSYVARNVLHTKESIYVFKNSNNTCDFGIKVSGNGIKLNEDNLKSIAIKYLQNILKQDFVEDIFNIQYEFVKTAILPFTAAGFKSLLQKLIRFRPLNVIIGEYNGKDIVIDSRIVLVITILLLFINPGSFVPDIQRFVTGPESVTKRLVVSLFEESYFDVENDSHKILKLLCGAYLFQRTKTFLPSESFVYECFENGVNYMLNNNFISYTFSEKDIYALGKNLRSIDIIPFKFSDIFSVDNIGINTVKNKLICVSIFMDELRSFQLDLVMMRWCAYNMKSQGYEINQKDNTKQRCNKFCEWKIEGITKYQPFSMPIEHSFDQHWSSEIAYFYPIEFIEHITKETSKAKPFEHLFRRIFKECTGYNPRRGNPDVLKDFENCKDNSFIYDTRYAQICSYMSRFKFDTTKYNINEVHKTIENSYIKIKYELDRSWISGMIGPILITGNPQAFVMLHPRDPELLITVRRPSREIKTEKDSILSDKREYDVIQQAKSLLKKGISLNKTTPPVSELKNKILTREEDEITGDITYYICDTKKKTKELWEDIRIVKRKYRCFEYVDRNLLSIIISPIDPSTKGEICYNYVEVLTNIVSNTPDKIIKRSLFFLKGFDMNIEFNRLSRDGSGTKNTVIPQDIGVYQFIIKLCDIIPSAIRRKDGNALSFEVVDGPLLWHTRDIIENIIKKNTEHISTENIIYDNWGNIEERRGRILKKHQSDALQTMIDRHLSYKLNHFLFMTVGSGKTLCVLSYLKYLLDKSHRNELLSYVIYTLPSSAIGSIIGECESMGFKVKLIDPRKNIPKNSQYLSYRTKIIEKYHINLIEHDHLRRYIDELNEVISESIFVIDEVHKCFNETQRTAFAQELAKLAQESIVLTGTPIIDTNTYKLMWYLKQITEFEVNEFNFWVAAAGMISKRYDPNIEILREDIRIEMTKEEKSIYEKLVGVKIGGVNKYPSRQDIMKAINLCYDIVVREIVQQTYKLLKYGGVFIVAHDINHAKEISKAILEKSNISIKKEDILDISGGISVDLTDENVNNKKVNDYKIVITSIRKSAGYNVTRLKNMISSEYPSDNATREQIEGRIVRIGQTAKSVKFVTVHTGILTYIMHNHANARAISAVVNSMADEI